MSFISLDFLIFASVVVLLYQALSAKYRVYLLLVASYVFYAWWDIDYIWLIILTTSSAFLAGQQIERASEASRQAGWLYFAVAVIIGQLFYFKYFDFFTDTVNQALRTEFDLLNVLLPIGISFYSLQALGYVIDVYRGKLKAERSPTVFALYVSFYPQLVAGPIERAGRLIPQLRELNPITAENLRIGLVHIAYGLVLKLVIGDRLAGLASEVFDNPDSFTALEVTFAAALQWIHVFCDFYGYSEMARGLAIVFGIKLIRNFNNPFLAANNRAFWQRWHISLTKWVFDYLYAPLVGRKAPQLRRAACLILTMTLIGFWHGASFNYIFFGMYHALLMLLQDQFQKLPLPKSPKALAIITNNLLILPSALLFMTDDLAHAGRVLQAVVTGEWLVGMPDLSDRFPRVALFALVLVLWLESRFRGVDELAIRFAAFPAPVRWLGYSMFVAMLLTFGMIQENDFVYFQF